MTGRQYHGVVCLMTAGWVLCLFSGGHESDERVAYCKRPDNLAITRTRDLRFKLFSASRLLDLQSEVNDTLNYE